MLNIQNSKTICNLLVEKYQKTFFILLFVFIAEATYWRANTLEFARLDDYSGLYNSKTNSLIEGVFHSWFQAGRIIPAFVGTFLFSLTDSVTHLWLLRIISTGILGIGGGIIACFVWRLFESKTISNFISSVFIGTITVTASASPSAATWATFASQILTLPIALMAGVLFTGDQKTSTRGRWLKTFVLLLLSAFCYQQFVALAILPVSMWAAVEFVSFNRVQIKRLISMTCLIALCLLINAIFVFSFGDGAQNRVLQESLSQRIVWFIGTYSPRTFDLFLPNSLTSVVLSTSTLIALSLILAGLKMRNLIFVMASAFSWAICASVVFPTQLWASYRLIHPAQIAIWSSITFSLLYVVAGRLKRYFYIALAGLSIFSLFVAGHRAENFIAIPNSNDWKSIKCEIGRNPSVNVFAISEWNTNQSPIYSYDEYGTVASNFDWVLTLAIKVARQEFREKGVVSATEEQPVLISEAEAEMREKGSYIAFDHQGCK